LLEEMMDMCGDDRADVGHFLNLLLRRLQQGFQRTEMRCERSGCRFAYIANAERI
jgi:hypothetical protein